MTWVMNIDNFRSEYTGSIILDGGGNGTIYELPNSNKVIKVSTVIRLADYDSECSVYDKALKSKSYKAAANLMAYKDDYPEIPIAKIYDVFFVHSNNEALYPNRVFSGEDNIASRAKSKDGYMYVVTVMEKLSKFQGETDDYKSIKTKLNKSLTNYDIKTGDETLMIRQIDESTVEPVLVDYDDWQVPAVGEL